MAMDNELRKILLREQDLRFVTDTLTQYLGKKAEDRKYYADQAHAERMEAKKLQAEAEKGVKAPAVKKVQLNITEKDWEDTNKTKQLLNMGFTQGFVGVDTKHLNNEQFGNVTSLGIDYYGEEDKPEDGVNYNRDITSKFDTELQIAEDNNNYSKIKYLKGIKKQIGNKNIDKATFESLKTKITGENYKTQQNQASKRYGNANIELKGEITSILNQYKNNVDAILNMPDAVPNKNKLIELQAEYDKNLYLQDDMDVDIVTYTSTYNASNTINMRDYEDLDGNKQSIAETGTNKAFLDMLKFVKDNNIKDEIVPMFKKQKITYKDMVKSEENFKKYVKMMKNKYLQGEMSGIPIYNIVDEVNLSQLTELLAGADSQSE